jgi:hypothetical protein
MNAALPFRRLIALLPGRKARAHGIRVTAICVGFAALLAAGLQHRRDLSEFFRSAMTRSALIGGTGAPGQSDRLRPVDPRSSFVEARVGLMLFAAYNNDICRRVMFDNRTGVWSEAGHIHCGQPPEQASDQLGQERALMLLKAFRK